MKELFLIPVFFFFFFQSFTQVKLSDEKFEVFEYKDIPHISQEIVDDLYFLTHRNNIHTYSLYAENNKNVIILQNNDLWDETQAQFLNVFLQKPRTELSSIIPPYEDSLISLEDGSLLTVYAPAEYIYYTLDSKNINGLHLVKEKNKYIGFAIIANANNIEKGYDFLPLFVKFEDLNKIKSQMKISTKTWLKEIQTLKYGKMIYYN